MLVYASKATRCLFCLERLHERALEKGSITTYRCCTVLVPIISTYKVGPHSVFDFAVAKVLMQLGLCSAP